MPVKISDAGTQTTQSLDQLVAEDSAKVSHEKAVNALSGLMTGTANVIESDDQIVHLPDEDAEAATQTETPIATLVDELADLLAWEAEQKKDARFQRIKELKKLFEDKANEAPDDDIVQFVGAEHTLQYGKKSVSRFIVEGGKEKILEMIGAETFLEIASIKLSDVDAYLTPKQKEQVLGFERGGRSLKVLDN